MTSSTPARPSAIAQARPSPLLAAQTIALRPAIPKSSMSPSIGLSVARYRLLPRPVIADLPLAAPVVPRARQLPTAADIVRADITGAAKNALAGGGGAG